MTPILFVLLCVFVDMHDASLDIIAGLYHNCVFEAGGAGMKCWGDNSHGQLGYEDTNNRGDNAGEMGADLPIVALGPNFVVNAASLGIYHSCVVSQEKAVKCWGGGEKYQLGYAYQDTLGDEVGEMGANLASIEFTSTFLPFKVTAGGAHSCVLSTDLLLVCFGRNDAGQCGAATSDEYVIGPPSNIAAVNLGSDFTPIDVSAFYGHSCALSQQQTIKCFGPNGAGQLGYGDRTARGQTLQSMGDGLPVVNLGLNFIPKAVAAGGYHSCALSTAKTLKCFGDNAHGQCGQAHNNENIGDEANEMGDNLPAIVLPGGFLPMQIALGRDHTCILSESAQVVCFGDNQYGQLGLGHTLTMTQISFNFTPVNLDVDFVPRKIVAGFGHTCAMSINDNIKCWGEGRLGALGLGHTDNIGDDAYEMGDDLPIVDVAYPTASPTTASPTSASPTTKAPTRAPSKQPSLSPTTSVPTTGSPSTTAPSSTAPTTAAPTTSYPTTTTPSKQQSVMNATASNMTSTSASTSSSPLSSAAQPVNNYTMMSTIQSDADINSTQITQAPPAGAPNSNLLRWLLYLGSGIASFCVCFALFTVVSCFTAKRRQDLRYLTDQQPQVEHQVEMSPMPLPIVPKVRAYGVDSESEEKKDDNPEPNAVANQHGACEPDFGHENSVDNDNRAEGLRASMVALAATSGGLNLEVDEFEVVDAHETTAGNYSANYVHARPTPNGYGMEEDEFEVVDDNEADMNSTRR